MIIINKPYIEKNDEGGRLIAEIQIGDQLPQKVWYSVENDYIDYFCYEKADAFLIMLLPYAMASAQDIVIKGAPISENIYWSLTRDFIPTLAKFSNLYKEIHIESDITNICFNSSAVGTGFSGGVDSFYTVLRNHKTNTPDCNLTHLTFFNVGACGYGTDFYGKNAREVFNRRYEQFKPVVEKLGLKFIKIDSNVYEFVPMTYNWIHSYRSMSAVLALQKLFKKYYYSSAGPLSFFSLDHHSSGFHDLLNTRAFSTESTDFYSVGLWESRIEKTEYISNYDITYGVLNVCNFHDTNCRVCDKCIRTMGGLYALKKLDKYSNVFDVDYFKKHLVGNLSKIIAKSYDGSVEAKYNKEIISKMRENNLHVPSASYLIAVPSIMFGKIQKLARKSKYLTKKNHQRLNKQRGLYFNDI